MTLGYISSFSETLALSVIISKSVPPLSQALITESQEHIKAACAWALGQIGRHSPDHAKSLAEHSVLEKLLKVLVDDGKCQDGNEDAGADLKTKTKRALKCILEKTLDLEALEPLLQLSTPTNVLKYVICQFSKILPNNTSVRRSFVTCGGLQRIQLIVAKLNESQTELIGTKLGEYVRIINECYPEEIVKYYSPGYSSTLLDKV
jgi:hypothetical protein